MLVFNSQSRQIILLWLSVCMIWGYFLHRKEGFTSFFIICIHCHIWSWNGLGSYGCLKNLCSFIHRYFHSYYCCCCNLQAKLHGSASTKVLSVSEKQPPPEEVWTQKVQISLGWFFFTTWLVVWSTVFAYVAVIMTSRFLADVLLLCLHSMGAFWNRTIRPSVCLSHGTAV